MEVSRRDRTVVLTCALFAMALKVIIAVQTLGSNDIVSFYQFAHTLCEHGLEWTYRHHRAFNHPPLIAYYLEVIYRFDHNITIRELGITFPLLLRLPGIVADLIVVLVLLRIKQLGNLIPTWALALFALSPVSLMVSGFHGNTDPIMVMFLVLAAYVALRDRPGLCGFMLALSCQVKLIPLLLLPILVFFWTQRGKALPFAVAFAALCAVLWVEPLACFPGVFITNVLAYGSFWGTWGITYWLRLTHWSQVNGGGAFHLPLAAASIACVLKAIIIGATVILAWRRQLLNARGLFGSIAYAWVIFFILTPGAAPQYMVWLVPFVLVISPFAFVGLTLSSSLFLFFFYNTLSREFPWYLAVSTSVRTDDWAPWAVWPWAVLVGIIVFLWHEARLKDPALRLLSLQLVRDKPEPLPAIGET
jgi:hypothetical protein